MYVAVCMYACKYVCTATKKTNQPGRLTSREQRTKSQDGTTSIHENAVFVSCFFLWTLFMVCLRKAIWGWLNN